jgi:co-chaperonin GroES (HSP10)
MKITNHSNRQPIGSTLVVFLDQLPNVKKDNGLWYKKKGGFEIGIDDKMRSEMMMRDTSGIVLAMGKSAFKDIPEEERPIIGDRVSFSGYSGFRKEEGDLHYVTLRDAEIHDYYIPQRQSLTKTK